MRFARALALSVAVGAQLAFAATATAQSEGTLDVTLTPNVAGAASTLTIEASGGSVRSEDELPRSIVVRTARGLRFDPGAVAGRCSPEQQESFACPESSRIGGGNAVVTVAGPLIPGGSRDFEATIDVFLGKPQRAGDVASVVVQVREESTGFRASARGRIIERRSGRFGGEVRFDIEEGADPPPGYTVTLRSARVTVGASRRVGGRRRSLLRNPRVCRGSWPYQIRVVFSDRTEVRNGAVRCRARRAARRRSGDERAPAFTG